MSRPQAAVILTNLGPAHEAVVSLRRCDALTLLAMYVSAVIHDYDHRGLTNAFLIQDMDPLAVSECVSDE